MTFDSKKEARRYSELLLLERTGAIHNLKTQVKGETVVEDTKGFRTKDYIIKRKLMLQVHGIRIREI